MVRLVLQSIANCSCLSPSAKLICYYHARHRIMLRQFGACPDELAAEVLSKVTTLELGSTLIRPFSDVVREIGKYNRVSSAKSLLKQLTTV